MGKNRERSKAHHTVPRFYLKRFADEREQVIRVPLDGKSAHRQSINSATVETDFYTVDLGGGELSDVFENHFSKLEGAAVPAFEAVLDEGVWPLPQDLKTDMARWVALQVLRTAFHRRVMDDGTNILLSMIVRQEGKEAFRKTIEDSSGATPSDTEVDAVWTLFTRPEGPRFETPAAAHIQQILDLLESTTTMYSHRSWSLFRFESDRLATSDNPVALVGDLSKGKFYGTGLANAQQTLFVLDRKTAIIINNDEEIDIEMPDEPQFVRFVRKIVAQHAYRALYHHPDDDPLEGISLPGPERQVVYGSDQYLTSNSDLPSSP